MTSVPTTIFTFTPDAAGDTHTEEPWITSIVVTDDGRLVMTGWKNKIVKVAEINSLATSVQTVNPFVHAATNTVDCTGGCMLIDTKPFSLALLRDGQVAVTGDIKRIYFVNVTGTPTVVSHVPTKRQYWGVGSLTDDDTLLAGCREDDDGPSSVDVLTRAGVVLKSVIDSSSLTALSWPYYLYVQNRTVWVSDYEAHAVYKVDIDTGSVVTTFSHQDIKNPMQVAVDKANNCYIASSRGNSELVVTSAGQWRRLLHGSEHGQAGWVCPRGLCVTDWGVVVTWDGGKLESGPDSVVSGYKLT